MHAFSQLLDSLYFTSGNLAKTKLIKDYLASTPDPDRGWAVAAITGSLKFDLFKRKLIKDLIEERVDPILFALSYDYVGEMSETVSHLWPSKNSQNEPCQSLPPLSEVVNQFQQLNRADAKAYLISLLDIMDHSQRWALIKLGTRGLRIGVSARFMKKVLAEYGDVPINDIETLWHGVEPPYTELLQWLEGKAQKPDIEGKVTFHPVMLSHPVDDKTLACITSNEWQVEYKYDGIRVQVVSTNDGVGLFSRTGDDISHSFPDIIEAIDFKGVFDGELLALQPEDKQKIASFNHLQQRLNKKKPSKKLILAHPTTIIFYDVLSLEQSNLCHLPLSERYKTLQTWFSHHNSSKFRLSAPLSFKNIEQLHALRESATELHDGFIEGLMLKLKQGSYVPGRPKGQWYKWKRDAKTIDAVMMYAQRGHGKRSSFYSDYTFGCWQDDVLLPIGKAYSGFTDEELLLLDKWVRNNTIGRFGPVKEVKKTLVLEVAFDAAHYSKRHKSGVALRFPRIHRIRWDKPSNEADQLSNLVALIAD